MTSEPASPAPSPAPPASPAWRDELITLSFADLQAGRYGQARLRFGPQRGRVQTAVVLFSGAQTLAVFQSDVPRASEAVVEHGPLRLCETSDGSWTADFDGGPEGQGAFALRLSPAGLALDAPAGDSVSGALHAGEQQLASVHGRLTVSGRPEEVGGIGQLSRSRVGGPPVPASVARELDAWLEDDLAICVRAARPRGVREHAAETVTAVMQEGSPARLLALDETRLSTTYDLRGQQRRASLEMWPEADSDYPRRAAAQAICGASLRLVADNAVPVRWDCAFMTWQMEGRLGVGPYSILRRLPASETQRTGSSQGTGSSERT